jgi:hypothetical protein
MIGGSIASSSRGIARATRDVDLVARIQPEQADQLAASLGKDWYADVPQMRDAIRRGQSFNVLYMPDVQKVDIFPAVDDFHATQLERATKVVLDFLHDTREYPVASAEDILLAKLRWYRMGGEVSERQWNDISDIVAINPNLDLVYLRAWALRLNVDDLLERAQTQA